MATEYPSSAMRQVLKNALLAARTDSIVLLTGESGSGKDFLARHIHEQSGRSGRFFPVNCAAIPPEIAESELFGHEPGSFTGTAGRKRGLVELADNGTVLLNEIGDLPLPLQAKLLTFLDDRTFLRVGGQRQVKFRARILAATNRDLQEEMRHGRFRHDLYFRLSVFPIHVPPLRERKEDLPVLVSEILRGLREPKNLTHEPCLDPSALELATRYDWPGNVRELRNVLERCVILSDGPRISAELFLNALKAGTKTKKPDDKHFPPIIRELLAAHGRRVRNPTPDQIRRIQEECMNDSMTQQEVAQALGVTQPTISRWLRGLP